MSNVEQYRRTGELLMRARDGDRSAWIEMVDSFSSLVWSVAWSFRLERHECEDAVQGVWLKLVQNLDSIQNPERLAGWITTTTRNECLAIVRTSRRTVLNEDRGGFKSPQTDGDDPSQQLIRGEERDAVRSALGRLDQRCRSLFELLGANLPYERISSEMEIPVGSIGPTRSRCLERLRKDPEMALLIRERESA